MATILLSLIAGLIILTLGAEGLIRGASRLATIIGIPPLIVGLTVVAFGTSAPELVVSIKSALQGQAAIAIGNVVGSNICNTLLILGIAATIIPLSIAPQLVKLDVPLMIGTAILFFLASIDLEISRFEGIGLFGLLIVYCWMNVSRSKKEKLPMDLDIVGGLEEDIDKSSKSILINLVFIGVGLVGLSWGADIFLGGAITIAKLFGLSELVIGLTVVAIGTSLPEIAATCVAAIKGERDIAVGNVVGSNIFNILSVIGVTASIQPIPVSEVAFNFDIPLMTLVCVLSLIVFAAKLEVARWQGVILLFYYFSYTAYLILEANQDSNFIVFENIMLNYLIPVSLLMLVFPLIKKIFNDRKNKAI